MNRGGWDRHRKGRGTAFTPHPDPDTLPTYPWRGAGALRPPPPPDSHLGKWGFSSPCSPSPPGAQRPLTVGPCRAASSGQQTGGGEALPRRPGGSPTLLLPAGAPGGGQPPEPASCPAARDPSSQGVGLGAWALRDFLGPASQVRCPWTREGSVSRGIPQARQALPCWGVLRTLLGAGSPPPALLPVCSPPSCAVPRRGCVHGCHPTMLEAPGEEPPSDQGPTAPKAGGAFLQAPRQHLL